MYSHKTGLTIGFHGCDKSTLDKVVSGGDDLKISNNDYDWLGSGTYFWENNYERALSFAEYLKDNPTHNTKQKIKTPAVIGAVINLLHRINEEKGQRAYDSVRAVFFEGEDLYENAGFKEKNHIQIAVRNPNCIKGYFIPRTQNNKYPVP